MRKTIYLFAVLLFFLPLIAQENSMSVASFNIRYDNPGDAEHGNGWKDRLPVIGRLIRFHDFDVLGIQEALHNQMQDLGKELPAYASTGVGRDDGAARGEYAAIFYKKEKYELLDQGHFWLSETPDVVGSKGWDAALPRICSWAKLKELATGFEFYIFNLHMDHIGKQAREESAKLVLRKVGQIAGNHHAIITGDFNSNQESEAYKTFEQSGIVKDTYQLAPIKMAANGTFSAFDAKRYTEERIDHIFVTGDFEVSRYGVLTDKYWHTTGDEEVWVSDSFPSDQQYVVGTVRLPSDHYPVVAGLRY